MNKELKEMTDIELKAIISDERDKIDIASNNVQIIRMELGKRAQAQSLNGAKPQLVE